MADRLRERLRHAVVTLLLSVGLVMPLCGALDPSLLSIRMAAVCAAVIIVFEAVSLHRIAAWSAAAAAAAGTALWILAGNGAIVLSDAGIAVSLRMQGIMTAVPLAAEPVSLVTAAGVTLLCCFASLKKATCIPAAMLCTAVMMVIWLTDSMELLPWLLPAMAAALALMMTSRYEDTGTTRILPWAAALTAAAYLLSGIAPAENPLKDRADEIRQTILDRLFFTEARDVFSLYSVGLSPQGPDQLGGNPDPSRDPVMQVSADRTVWLRGTVYNRYDGHGWQNTTGGRRYLWQSGLMASTRAALFDEMLPSDAVQNTLSEPVTVSVRMLSDSASTLFVPQRVRELNPGGEMVPYFSNSSEIFITRNLLAGDTYEISAPLYSADEPGIAPLIQSCAAQDDPRWESVRNIYLELPSHLEKPLTELAARMISGNETPYEKALAIREYLRKNYTYTMDVADHPENVDFVTSFLLRTKKGYCTYFASAMTVLCRIAGLPARYVEGYLAVPNANGEAVVTGMDAHAWTEVYFEGFGWLTFDATPGRASGGQQDGTGSGQADATPEPPPIQTPTPTPSPATDPDDTRTPAPSDEPTREPTEEPSEDPGQVPPEESPEPSSEPSAAPDPQGDRAGKDRNFPWWLFLLLIPAAVGIRFAVTSPAFLEKRARTENRRFEIWTEEVAALLRAEKLERRSGETVMAFARRVDGICRFSESVSPAAECLSVIRYSTAHPLESDTGLMRDTALLLRSEMNGKSKVRYFAGRILPRKDRGCHPAKRNAGRSTG